jgi:multisubunit Na+/H+ antiporter MnhF subunit
VIGYLILSLGGGIMGFTFENVNLMIDIRLFLAVAMVLSLLGFAKSVLQAINYQSEKAEQQLI